MGFITPFYLVARAGQSIKRAEPVSGGEKLKFILLEWSSSQSETPCNVGITLEF